jgi:hypothetical protein
MAEGDAVGVRVEGSVAWRDGEAAGRFAGAVVRVGEVTGRAGAGRAVVWVTP